MSHLKTTALAHPNIAFIKYWGNLDSELRLPVNSSISMNLAALETRTRVVVDPSLKKDKFFLDGCPETGPAYERVSSFLSIIRNICGSNSFAEVISENNFPKSAGIASSASGFAALAAAGASAYGLQLSEIELSRLARRGSGSAARSVPAGFVVWHASDMDENSYAESIAPPHHWILWDCIAVVETGEKKISSSAGHLMADTSVLQPARVADTPRRLDICCDAIKNQDFHKLAEIIELDSNLLHAVMMTSRPPLLYWSPVSLRIIQEVPLWRKNGLQAAFTLDARPNVHVICTSESQREVSNLLQKIPGVQQVLISQSGGGTQVLFSSED